MKVIMTSSSDKKLQDMNRRFPDPPLTTINYVKNPEWHMKVLEITDGSGVDLVIEVGGNSSLVQSIKCTRRGGIVSLVGYLGKEDIGALTGLSSSLIDRRVILR
jgi:threonine dehydrogenase-like Zn-dependent dehydrogenase